MNILQQFKNVRKIKHGISSDEKYYVESTNGEEFFLRIFDEKLYTRRKNEFEMMQDLDETGVPIAKPVDLGMSEGKGYYTTEWLEGKTLSSSRKDLSNNEIYSYGLRAGKVLKKIHSMYSIDEEWASYYIEDNKRLIKMLEESELVIDKLGIVTDYFNSYERLLKMRPSSLLHNDYGSHNIMISSDGSLSVFDFANHDYGDAWSDFRYAVPPPDKRKCREDANFASFFPTGCIHGYFDVQSGNTVPQDFWPLFALYSILQRTASITYFFNKPDILEKRVRGLEDELHCYDDMKVVKPIWYENTIRELLR